MEAILVRRCSVCTDNLSPVRPFLCLSFFDSTPSCSNGCGCSGTEGADSKCPGHSWPSELRQIKDERWESRLNRLYCSFAWRDWWKVFLHLWGQSSIQAETPFLRFVGFQDICSWSSLSPWRVPSNRTLWCFRPWNTCFVEWCSFSSPIYKLSRSTGDIFSSCDRCRNQDIAACTASNTNARIL